MTPSRALRILYHLSRRKAGIDPPHGINLSKDLRRLVPAFDPHVVFDVGANRGQTAALFAADFPKARIYCFEPVRQTFLELQRNTRSMPRVECHNLALGSSRQIATMSAERKSELSRVTSREELCTYQDAPARLEQVQMDTVRDFCHAKHVHHVNLLKVDTEGHDMEVLRGAEALLNEQLIDVVQVEAGLSISNTTHVPFEEFRKFLETRSYFIFGFYDQTHEFPTMKPNLRRANAAFLSKRLIDMTTTA